MTDPVPTGFQIPAYWSSAHSPDRAGAQRRPPGRREALILAVGLLLPPLGAFFYFVVLDGSSWSGLAYAASKCLQFALPLLILGSLLGDRPSSRLERRPSIGTGLAVGLLLGLPLILFYETMLRGGTLASRVGDMVLLKMDDFRVTEPLPYLLMSLFLSFLHSGLEEYYWRFFVYGRLRRFVRCVPAIMIASAGFTSHHLLVMAAYTKGGGSGWFALLAGTIAVFLAGALWCWLYERTGNLWAAWISHVIADLALMTLGARLLWG